MSVKLNLFSEMKLGHVRNFSGALLNAFEIQALQSGIHLVLVSEPNFAINFLQNSAR